VSRAESLLRGFGSTASANLGSRPRDVGVVASSVRLQSVDLDRIVPDPDNPRGPVEESAVDAMAANLSAAGLIQPIRLRWSSALLAWMVVTGHTRVAAARRLGWKTIDAICYPEGTPVATIRTHQLGENLIRSNPDPLATASALRDLMTEWKCNAGELSDRLGIHKSTVSRLLALLKADPEIQRQVAAGSVSLRQAVVRKPRRGRGGRKPRSVDVVLKLSRTQRVVVTCHPDDDVDAILRAALESRKADTRAA
jgi:ParB family chromosome partitioning protein